MCRLSHGSLANNSNDFIAQWLCWHAKNVFDVQISWYIFVFFVKWKKMQKEVEEQKSKIKMFAKWLINSDRIHWTDGCFFCILNVQHLIHKYAMSSIYGSNNSKVLHLLSVFILFNRLSSISNIYHLYKLYICTLVCCLFSLFLNSIDLIMFIVIWCSFGNFVS